jgi:hypothetical protein
MDALNSAVDAMSPSVYRPYFARRIRKAGAPAYAIKILFAEGRFWIKNDAKRKIVVSTSGETIEWTQEDGQVFDISAQVTGEAISLTFHAIDASERTTSYCSDGQQLVTETTIIGPLLSTPIHYRVVYNRVADRVYESDFMVQAVERPSSRLRMPLQMTSPASALRQARS